MHPVSILIPTYARTQHLEEAIRSALDQRYDGEFDVVVLNDCPWQTLSCADRRVTIFNNPEPFRTLGDKRNALLALGRQDWAVWLDDDDLILPHHLSRMMAVPRAEPLCLAVKSTISWFKVGMPPRPVEWREAAVSMEVACRRHDGLFCGGFDSIDSGEDQSFTARLAATGCMTVLNKGPPSYVYCWSNGVHHISGSGRPIASDWFRAEADRRRREGMEPEGAIEIMPRFHRDYVTGAPSLVRDGLGLRR
jgi:glycosyltransferase involved in cell wall biosynthesis